MKFLTDHMNDLEFEENGAADENKDHRETTNESNQKSQYNDSKRLRLKPRIKTTYNMPKNNDADILTVLHSTKSVAKRHTDKSFNQLKQLVEERKSLPGCDQCSHMDRQHMTMSNNILEDDASVSQSQMTSNT